MPDVMPDAPLPIAAFSAAQLRAFANLKTLQLANRHDELLVAARELGATFPELAAYTREFEGLAHKGLGQLEMGISCFREAMVAFDQPPLSLFANLGECLQDAKRGAEAEVVLREGLALYPGVPKLRWELCRALVETGKLAEALVLARCLCDESESGEVWFYRATAAMEAGLHEEALEAFKKCWQRAPGLLTAWHDGLFMAHYMPHLDSSDLSELFRQWYEATGSHYVPTPAALLERNRDPDKKLRIGVFSSGLRRHPAGWMASRPLSLLARLPAYELFFYNTSDTVPVHDEVRDLFKSAATYWHEAGTWSDARLYEQVLDDRLDLAIDMSGHGDGTVLPLFATRLAPIQIKWVGGLFSTTGVPAMDYLLSDRFETPAGVDEQYTEKLVRLPHSYIAYVPPDYGDNNEQEPLRDRSDGIVFGCFNNALKINPIIVKVWAGILHRVPGSVLFFKGKRFDWPEKRQIIENWFAEHGIGPERLRFEGGSLHYDLLCTYRQVDIALDTWPYTGGLTTLEALWMGVPVITTPGPTFAGRHAASHLCNAGLPEFVQPTFAAYADMAVELANQPDLLDHLRHLLRLKIATSPLVNHRQLAADLDTAFRAMWQRHCEGLPPIAMRFEAPSPVPDVFAL